MRWLLLFASGLLVHGPRPSRSEVTRPTSLCLLRYPARLAPPVPPSPRTAPQTRDLPAWARPRSPSRPSDRPTDPARESESSDLLHRNDYTAQVRGANCPGRATPRATRFTAVQRLAHGPELGSEMGPVAIPCRLARADGPSVFPSIRVPCIAPRHTFAPRDSPNTGGLPAARPPNYQPGGCPIYGHCFHEGPRERGQSFHARETRRPSIGALMWGVVAALRTDR